MAAEDGAAPEDGGTPGWLGRVTDLSVGDDRTQLSVRLSDGTVMELALPVRPDPARARRYTAGARRIRGVHLRLRAAASEGPDTAWLVVAVGRYREQRRPVPLAVALALTERGVPTQVRLEAPVS